MSTSPMTPATKPKTAVEALRDKLQQPSIKEKIAEALRERAPQFATALLQLMSGSDQLQKCDPNTVIGAAMTAAILDLPIDKNLGFAHIVPYAGCATFQMGYKGLIQLAIRSGQYRRLNAVEIFDGELKSYNRLTGEAVFDFSAVRKADMEPVGYAAYFQLVTGYEQTVFWSRQDVLDHAARYSQAYRAKKKDSPWFTAFDSMALKTVVKDLLSHWGILSVQLQKAITSDGGVRRGADINTDPEFPTEPEPTANRPVHTVEVSPAADNPPASDADDEIPMGTRAPADKPPVVADPPAKPAATEKAPEPPTKQKAPPVEKAPEKSPEPPQVAAAPAAPTEAAAPVGVSADEAALHQQVVDLCIKHDVSMNQVIAWSKGARICPQDANAITDFVAPKLKMLVTNFGHVVTNMKKFPK